MKIPQSTLFILFNGQWENKLPKDQNGNIVLDFNPIELYPPLQPSLSSSDKKNLITFNVGVQKITNQRTTFTQVSNSTFD